MVTALDAAGLQVHFHAIGDAAVHDALDAVEAARRTNGMSGLRHQIAHLQLVRPEDRHRFGDLQVVANLQGMWARRETPAVDLIEPHLDDERLGWHYPFRDILDGGARFSGGSDWPVNPPEPIGAVHVLVNRRAWTGGPGQAAEPLVVPTRRSAWRRRSRRTPGARRGPTTRPTPASSTSVPAPTSWCSTATRSSGPPDEIGACEVASTWAQGQLVYQA